MSNTEVNYKNVASIDTSGSAKTGSWAVLSQGFDGVNEALNEVVEKFAWLSDAGFGRSQVTGMQIAFSLPGTRVIGDTAQDYIFSDAVKYGLGSARETQIKFERVNPATNAVVSTITVDCTLVKITPPGGKTQESGKISVDIDCNGAPSFTVAYTADQTLKVVSLAGTGTGKSSIYVNPVKGGSNSLKFKILSALPAIGSILTTGWTALTAGADAIASGVTTGDTIVVAEVVTATNALVKAGTCTITTG